MFTGFTEETIAFFAALRVNNNRDFFESQRDVYERAVRGPLLALAETLAPVVSRIDPALDLRPSRTVSRIHRDLRFRKDQTPYRDYMWVGFRQVGESRMETCGFYFDISAEASHWGCGFYHAQQDTMQQFRQKLVTEERRVLRILREKRFAKEFEVLGDAYVRQYRPPKNMPEILAALYPKKSVYAQHTLEDMGALFSPDIAERIASGFEALGPFYTLLRECTVKRIEGVEG